jgi:hypothetical protein
MNLRWPNKKDNNLLPWYYIIRRAIGFPLIIWSIGMTIIFLYLFYGKELTLQFIENLDK